MSGRRGRGRTPRKYGKAMEQRIREEEERTQRVIEQWKRCLVVADEDLGVTCPICTEVSLYPMKSTTCGHSCCLICWRSILKDKKCPMCRGKVTTNNLRLDSDAEDIICQLPCSCRNQGCTWKGNVSEFRNLHIENCLQNFEKLPKWVKELNDKKSEVITVEDEYQRTSDTLNLLRALPTGSIITRAYLRNQDGREGEVFEDFEQEITESQRKVDQGITSFTEDLLKIRQNIDGLAVGFERITKQHTPTKTLIDGKLSQEEEKEGIKKNDDDLAIDFDESEDSKSSDDSPDSKNSITLQNLTKSSGKKPSPFMKHQAVVKRKEKMVNMFEKETITHQESKKVYKRSISQIPRQETKLLNKVDKNFKMPKIDFKEQMNEFADQFECEHKNEYSFKRKRRFNEINNDKEEVIEETYEVEQKERYTRRRKLKY
ncbi:unnamed protein product [Moneuplotes crassus]|uniref:RING-type domain-containing protein n=1 Tax=Euplotes crassus TaxID=5936 RepID=A0AAD1UD16_EUPCR|nr:unnamed protein product [Moneuplotes crassus]